MSRVHAMLLVLMLTPAAAQEAPQGDIGAGTGLLREGARLLLRGLMGEVEPAIRDFGAALGTLEPMLRDLAAMMDDLSLYDAPVMLPNGDILIRRRPDKPELPPPDGSEIEL